VSCHCRESGVTGKQNFSPPFCNFTRRSNKPIIISEVKKRKALEQKSNLKGILAERIDEALRLDTVIFVLVVCYET
jgi:hypothetical protein